MKVEKNDWIELQYTGKSNGVVFDSNVPEEAKKLNPDAAPEKTIISVGNSMVVVGLDRALEGKEIGKTYEVDVPAKEAFGTRQTSLVRTIPLKNFTSQQVYPQQGMSLLLDNSYVKIVAVSGARVIADFNNPLAGKDLHYSFSVARKVENDKEKAESFFKYFLRFVPEFEVNEKVIMKGPKPLEYAILIFKDKFKQLVGKDLELQIVEKEPDKEDKAQAEQQSL